MATKNKKPAIRFKGFTEDWKIKKAESLCSISTGKNNTQDKIDGGKYPFYVRSATIERSNNYIFDEEAVLTVGDGVGTGKVYHYVNGKYDLHQRVYRMFDFKEVSGKYFFNFFSNNFQKRVKEMTAKSSVDSVRLEMISNMNIIFPELIEEQKKIGTFFQNLDNLITQHQKKHEKLVILKKAMLDKMFPKNGSKVPEIRFKGFTGEWEDKIIDDFGKILTGSTPSTQNKGYYSKNGIPWVTPTDIKDSITLLTERHLTKEGKSVARIIPKNSILVTCIASIGKNTILGTEGSCNQQINAVVPNKNIYNPYFLFILSNHWSNYMKKRASSGTMQIVNKDEFSKIKTSSPGITEQTKIGNYFKNLDKQINLHQTQLEKLKNIKNACLSKMFVA